MHSCSQRPSGPHWHHEVLKRAPNTSAMPHMRNCYWNLLHCSVDVLHNFEIIFHNFVVVSCLFVAIVVAFKLFSALLYMFSLFVVVFQHFVFVLWHSVVISVCGWFVPLWCPILAFLWLLCIYLWCPVPLCCFASLWLFCVSGCLVPLCTCFAHFYDLFSVFVVVLYPYFVMSCLFILISSLINPFIAHNNRAASMYPVHWLMTKYVNTTSLCST